MSLTTRDTPDKVYYDITVSNLGETTNLPRPLYFNETRNSPFVLDPASYYLSIVRFTLDTNTLPLFIPEIQPDQSNRNLTNYSVTLSWTNPIAPFQTFNQQQFIIFVPQNQVAIVPAPPSQTTTGLQNNLTGYYDVFNYTYFIKLINDTLLLCFNNLNAQVVAAGLVLPTTHAPVMSWDVQGSISILNADKAGYNDNTSNYIKIYFNNSLFFLFSSFPFIIESDAATLGKNARLIMSGFGGANEVQYPPVTPTYTALQIVQEYSTTANWTPITSLVFTSNTLPIVANQVSAPLLFFDGAQYSSGGNNSNIAQVLTDFVADSGQYKPFIEYLPTAQYRLISLTGNTPLYNIDIEVFYKNRVGTLVPFRLGSGATATIKLLFTRRGTEGDSK
ncbi:MAG: hypothetical protein EBU90_19385 [Proteobacteria bacterium]|nr:hypothetical protein [Pseudomonadota bacterium]